MSRKDDILLKEIENAKRSDLRNPQVPEYLYWSCEEVADFMESINYPQYRECILSNQINGRRLIWMDASHLPSIGINDFKHIINITQKIRELMKIEKPDWNRSVSVPERENLSMYLEFKSFVGENSNTTSYEKFEKETRDAKWQPPLTNQGFILPSY